MLRAIIFECCEQPPASRYARERPDESRWKYVEFRWDNESGERVSAVSSLVDKVDLFGDEMFHEYQCLPPMNCESYVAEDDAGAEILIPANTLYETRLLSALPSDPGVEASAWLPHSLALDGDDADGDLEVLVCGREDASDDPTYSPYTCDPEHFCSINHGEDVEPPFGSLSREHWCCNPELIGECGADAELLDPDYLPQAGLNVAMVVGVTVGVLLVVALAAGVAICAWKRYLMRRKAPPMPHGPPPYLGKPSMQSMASCYSATAGSVISMQPPGSVYGKGQFVTANTSQSISQSAYSAAGTLTVDSMTSTAMPTFVTPSEAGVRSGRHNHWNTSMQAVRVDEKDRRAVLERQLDWLIQYEDALFLKKYKLQRLNARRVGGQGLVIFANSVFDQAMEFAIKFYYDISSFQVERDFACNPKLRMAMPAVEAIVEHNEVLNTSFMPAPLCHHPLPPMIVTQKGQALDEFIKYSPAEPNYFTCLDVMVQVAQRLESVHAVHMVHRDLKPSNVIRLVASNTWSLIDFGCAADAGEVVPLSYSVPYAAPETIAQLEAGQKTVEADKAVDVFALGIMCWELLTAGRFYGFVSGDVMKDALLGHSPLPSEAAELPLLISKRPAAIREPLMQMLSRNPQDRPDLASVVQRWRRTFEVEQTVTVA